MPLKISRNSPKRPTSDKSYPEQYGGELDKKLSCVKNEHPNLTMKKQLKIILSISSVLFLTSCVWNSTESDPTYLPLNDSEYPYAELPRLVIETEDFREIRNTETEIPAKLQIYGKSAPESEVLNLTVKGRGNSSFRGMPKNSIKLEFDDKIALLGMPKDRDWALIANSADKSLLKNYISYKLFSWLGAPYSPRTQFVELYFNRSYLGVYLLTETLKGGKNRVDIPEDGSAFLVETDEKYRDGDQVYFSESTLPLNIHYPHNITDADGDSLVHFIDNWANYLNTNATSDSSYFNQWINVEAYIRFYWMQEFAINHDGYGSSTYFTWQKGNVIQMGPIWDMDMAYGEPIKEISTIGWRHNNHGWNEQIFKNKKFKQLVAKYWKNNHNLFSQTIDSATVYAKMLQPAAKNEFKRWPVLENTENWMYTESFNSYNEAVDSLKSWIQQRITWIDANL